jgi:hypothetical protein
MKQGVSGHFNRHTDTVSTGLVENVKITSRRVWLDSVILVGDLISGSRFSFVAVLVKGAAADVYV